MHTEVEAGQDAPSIDGSRGSTRQATVIEPGDGVGEKDSAPPVGDPKTIDLPPSLATRFAIERRLVPGNERREVLLVRELDSNTPFALKLVSSKSALAPNLLANRVTPTDPALLLPIEQGSWGPDGGYELQPFVTEKSLSSWLARAQSGKQTAHVLLNALAAPLLAMRRTSGEGAHGSAPAAVWNHCDIKPENLLVIGENPLQLALIDFGSATLVDAPSVRQGRRGRTIEYSPPELGQDLVFRNSDLWSAGMITYELLLGRHPMAPSGIVLPANGLTEACRAQLADGWQPTLSAADREQSGEQLARAIEGMLTAAPTERWGHDDLAACLRNEDVENDPRQRQHARATEVHPYRIAGQDCHDVKAAARAMVGHWNEGIDALFDPGFHEWLTTASGRPDLADSARAGLRSDADFSLLRFAYWANPDMPPIWKEVSMERYDLIAIAGEVLRAARGKQTELAETRDALALLGNLRKGFVPADQCWALSRDWRNVEGEIRECYRTVIAAGAPISGLPSENLLAALALLLACDGQRVEPLRAEVAAAFVANVPRQSWFHVWGRDARVLTVGKICALRTFLEASVGNSGIQNIGSPEPPSPVARIIPDQDAPPIPPPNELIDLNYRFAFDRHLV